MQLPCRAAPAASKGTQILRVSHAQTFIVHVLRTERIPFIESCAAWPLMLSTFGVMAFGVAICYIPGLSTAVALTPVIPSYYIWMIGTIALYCVTVHVYKIIYIRVFKSWL